MRINHFRILASLSVAAVCSLTAVKSAHAGGLYGMRSDDIKTEASKFRIGVNLRQGWDSNVHASSFNEVDSMFTEASLRVDTNIGDARTNLNIALDAGATYYWEDIDDELSPNIRLSLNLNHSVTPRLSLGLSSYFAYQIEPDYSSSLATARRSGNYLFTNNVVSATYLWTPRLSTVTRYSFVAVRYDDSEVGQIEDRMEHYFSQEARFLVLPQTTAVLEYRFGIVDYNDLNDDSISHFAIGGFDHNFTPRVRASIRGGAEFRSYDEDGEQTSPYGELTVTYNFRAKSSVSWVNRYGLEQSDIVGEQTNTTFRSGLRVDHAISGKINLYLGAYYQHSNYEYLDDPETFIDPVSGEKISSAPRPEFADDLLELNAGLRFQVHRNLTLDAGYTFTTVTSDEAFREYDRHRVYVGLQATF